MKQKYKYIKQDDNFVFYKGRKKLKTIMGSSVTTKYESIAERLVLDLNEFGESPSNPISLVAFHYYIIDFCSNKELERDFLEHSITIGLEKDKDWTFNCPSENPDVLMVWQDKFGLFEEQSIKVKGWVKTLSIMQLCAICVIGRALESFNIPYIISNRKDVNELDHYSQFINEFYPYIGIEDLNKYFANLLFYFNIERGNDNELESQVKNNLSDAVNTLYYLNGDIYVGQAENNSSNGMGTYYCANGCKFIGHFKNNERDDIGTEYYSDGSKKYEGHYKNDMRQGNGTYYFDSGDKYVGEFKNDKKNGKGTYYFTNGDKYEGDFINDNFEGTGTFYFINGEKYLGQVRSGKRNGMGSYWFTNGDTYVGEWLDDKREGTGTEYSSNGSIIFKGTYSNGKAILHRSEEGEKIDEVLKVEDKAKGKWKLAAATIKNNSGEILYLRSTTRAFKVLLRLANGEVVNTDEFIGVRSPRNNYRQFLIFIQKNGNEATAQLPSGMQFKIKYTTDKPGGNNTSTVQRIDS